MNETKQKGLLTELQCQTYFTQLGYNVSIPLGEDCRYDMIVDINGQLIRVQVKTCHQIDNGITFSTRSTQINTQQTKQKTYNPNEIDYFATYWNNKVYLIKVDDCLSATRTLLFEKKKINQGDIYFIEDYEVEKTLDRLQNNLPEPKVKTAIYQIDKDGNIVGIYSSTREAAEQYFNDASKNSHISAAINGRVKTAYNFYWERRFI